MILITDIDSLKYRKILNMEVIYVTSKKGNFGI